MTDSAWSIEWRNRAVKDARQLSLEDRRRVIDAVDAFASTGAGDIRPLQARPGQWRLRVGDYRIIFEQRQTERSILILRVLPRDQAYRR